MTNHPLCIPDDLTDRTELSHWLREATFPAGRDELIGDAEANDASEAVLEALRTLPPDQSFQTVYDVWVELGGTVEHVEGRPE